MSPLASRIGLSLENQPKFGSGSIPNVGLFGTPGSLPSGAGPVDPPILTQGGNYPQPSGPLWTRMDPNMGYINPSLTINPGESQTPRSGPFPGGDMGGRQGSVYTTDPNTGEPIYNVTGSPKPGFFDSKTGKFVETMGSIGGNILFPGAGTISKAIFDIIRRSNNAKNTGTDLSQQSPPGGGVAGGGPNSGLDWFQPGYKPPAGIQDAIRRGDYPVAYGQSPAALADLKIMESQAYGGNPNQMPVGDEGASRFYPHENAFQMNYKPGAPTLYAGDAKSVAAYNAWLMQQPEYSSWMAAHHG